MTGGLLAELIYAEQPRIIHDLKVSPDDPAAEYLAGMSSLQAIPQFDRGKSLNMVISMHRAKNAFDPAATAGAGFDPPIFLAGRRTI